MQVGMKGFKPIVLGVRTQFRWNETTKFHASQHQKTASTGQPRKPAINKRKLPENACIMKPKLKYLG